MHLYRLRRFTPIHVLPCNIYLLFDSLSDIIGEIRAVMMSPDIEFLLAFLSSILMTHDPTQTTPFDERGCRKVLDYEEMWCDNLKLKICHFMICISYYGTDDKNNILLLCVICFCL